MKKHALLALVVVVSTFYPKVIHLPKNVKIWKGFILDPAKRISSYPYISGDTFRAFCDHAFDEITPFLDVDAIKAGDTLFLVADFFPFFFSKVYPYIRKPFVLVSHNRDASVPGRFAKYLDDEKIVAWFSVNIDREHPKLHAIPIGLANGVWPHGKIVILEKILRKQIRKRILLCASYISMTHASRKNLYNYFKGTSYCYFPKKKTFEAYLADLKASKFVLSPRGNGIDCHRTWEALVCGAIPIVPSTTINSVYEGLPVYIIDDWRSINKPLLTRIWNRYQREKPNYEKLYADYWFDQIILAKESVRFSMSSKYN